MRRTTPLMFDELLNTDPVEQRYQFAREDALIFVCIAYTLNYCAILRIPVAVYSHGSSFVAAYIILSGVFGYPLTMLDIVMGQYHTRGPYNVFKVCPLFEGLGLSIIVWCLLTTMYYVLLMGHGIYLMSEAFTEVPQLHHDRSLTNTAYNHSRLSSSTTTAGTTTKQNLVSLSSKGVTVNFTLALCTLVAWLFVFIAISNSLIKKRKLVMYTYISPPVLLASVCTLYIVKPGFKNYFYYITFNDADHFFNVETWVLAFEHVLYGLGTGTGVLLTFSSYNSFYSNHIRKDVTIINIVSFLLNIASALITLHNTGVITYHPSDSEEAIDEVEIPTSPTELQRLYFTMLKHLPAAAVWMFFASMLLIVTGTIGCAIFLEVPIRALMDNYNIGKKKRWVQGIACVIMFLVSFPMYFWEQTYVANAIDAFVCGKSLVYLEFLVLSVGDDPTEPEKKIPVIKLIAPNLKETESLKASDIKVNLENVKEQSLEKPIPISEPINKIKEKLFDLKPKETEQVKPPPKKRKRVDLSVSSLERNFITPVRAMSDFLLKPSDLESLPKTKRRSPYENEPPITVYWRRDVEAKALEVWGSKEKLQTELIKRDIERKKYQQNIFTVKRRLRDYRREMGKSADVAEAESGLMGRSGKVVITAVIINGTNCLFKLFAWLYTGSHSMFSECIHSFADTVNQLILAYGIHKSVQIADSYHPYGYSNMKYVASLISGVGIFCVGTGLSIYHGVTGLLHPQPIEDFFWAYFILGGSLVSEGATWIVAFNSIRKGAREVNMSVKDYIFRGQDPSVNVVLLEDFAAVVGVAVAACCMGISSVMHNPVPDAIGSLLVGGILGAVASFIIYTNVAALVGRSIPQEMLDKINCELESDVMVRAIHDVKGIDMGNYLVRYKAEMDFDGRELTRAYLDKQDLNALLEEVKKFENIDQLEEFMLKHGETIVDMLGGEIDRIEMKLRKKHPEIRHCDLEIL